MEIGKINNSTNFGARIVIQKTGFKNLGKDIIDSLELSSLSGGSSGSATTETTIFPSDIVKGGKFANYINKCIDGMKETFESVDNMDTDVLYMTYETLIEQKYQEMLQAESNGKI
jgi:hypothetical protein